MIRKNKDSIRTRFNRFFISIVSIIILLFSFLIIFNNVKQIETGIVHRMTDTVELSKINLSNALWQFNYAYINNFIESILLNEDMVYIAVFSNEENIYESKAEAYSENDFDFFQKSNGFITRDVELYHEGFKLGSIQLVMSKASIRTSVFQIIIFMFILMIAIISAIYFVISYSTNRFIFSPLKELEQTVEQISIGAFDVKAKVVGNDEISKLAVSFNMMMDNLKTITASRDELNTEISTRERAEESLSESNERYLDLMNSLGTGVILHAPDTSIILSNPKASEILGISPEQMKGKKGIDPQWRFVRNDGTDMPLEEYPVNKALSLMKSFTAYFIGIKRPDRNYITWVDVNASIVFDEKNKIKYVTISFNDTTKQKLAEEELTKHREHLEELVKERTSEAEEKTAKLEKTQQSLTLLMKDVNKSRNELNDSNEELEKKYIELERYNSLFAEREFRIKELRDKVKELEKKNEK